MALNGFDGSGNFIRTFPEGGWKGDAAAGIKIKSDRHDDHDNAICNALSNMICKDGQSTVTADIPFSGKKITNLGAPVAATDAATKGYADSVKTFGTAITINGSALEARIKFTGTTGPWGLQFPDLFFGVRAADDPVATPPVVNRFHWNDKADATGRELMSLTEASALTLFGVTDAAAPSLVLNTKRDADGAHIIFQQHSTTPAATDSLGLIDFYGKTSTATDQLYARIIANIEDPTVSSEDGEIHLQTRRAGTFTDTLRCWSAGVNIDGNLVVSGNINTFSASGLQYVQHQSDHVATYKKTGVYNFYWRRTDNGLNDGANSAELMSLTDAGRLTAATIAATGTAGSHGIHGTATSAGFSGVIGYYGGIFGSLGMNTGGQTWGAYTNGSGYAPSGTWQGSDASIKTNIKATDTAAALQQVLAVPVHSFTRKLAKLTGVPGAEVGWLAQEIEPVIPQAVMDVAIPGDDKVTRDMISGDTLKATNNSTMLATLWAAVQEQAGIITALQAKVAALEAA